MPVPAIAIRRLSRAFRARQVLRDVNLDVPHGAVACILGANGSGKTTLLEILATLLHPTSGQAFVHGLEVTRAAAAIRRIVGYGLSNPQSFYPQLSARRNLEFFASIHGLEPRPAARRTGVLLEALGLGHAPDICVQEFSDGMKARLSIARALVADPCVLLLDEPTKSVDEAARTTVRELATSTTAGGEPRTVVWTTHDRREALAIADCVRVLDKGELRDDSARAWSAAGQAVPA
jgi:ABC-2 type transport system ATP-binding protein